MLARWMNEISEMEPARSSCGARLAPARFTSFSNSFIPSCAFLFAFLRDPISTSCLSCATSGSQVQRGREEKLIPPSTKNALRESLQGYIINI